MDRNAFRVGPLSAAPVGLPFRVRSIGGAQPELQRQLEDIGFHAGVPVLVMVRGFPGGDPLAIRVGESTFALRAGEAACIEVEAAAAG